jgi:hypothetical protein
MYNVGSLDFFEITAISLREQETTEHRGTATREPPGREHSGSPDSNYCED